MTLGPLRFTNALGGTANWIYPGPTIDLQSPASAQAANGAKYLIYAEATDRSQWEIATGAYTSSSGTFARTTVLFNSLGTTAKINFVNPPQVYVFDILPGLPANNTWTGSNVFNSNTGAPVAPDFPSPIQMVGADGANQALTMDVYGGANVLEMRVAGGTQAAKTAVVANTQLSNVAGAGWNGSSYVPASLFVQWTAENWSGTANGTYTSFYTIAIGSIPEVERMRLQPSGGLSIGATSIASDPGIGNVNIDGTIKTGAVLVASLPAAGKAGRRSFVTNATATTFASIVAGGGTNGVPVYDDGTNWRIG